MLMPFKYFQYLYGVKTSYNRVLGRNLANRIDVMMLKVQLIRCPFWKAWNADTIDAKTWSAKSMSFSKRSDFGFDAVSCYGEVIGVFELSW